MRFNVQSYLYKKELNFHIDISELHGLFSGPYADTVSSKFTCHLILVMSKTRRILLGWGKVIGYGSVIFFEALTLKGSRK